MHSLVGQSFIRRRYMAALAGLALLGVAVTGFAYREAEQNHRVTEAYDAVEDINREVIRTLTAISRRVTAPGTATNATSRTLLNQIALLDAQVMRFARPDGALPAEIAAMFAPPRDAGRDFAAFVVLARELAGPALPGGRGVDPRYPILLSIAENTLQPVLDEVSAILHARGAANRARLVEGGVAGLVVLLIGLVVIRNEIFYPMEQHILEAQAGLERETDRARRAERSKGAFLANMSHEIRTSLNGVIGMAELLARTRLDEEQGQFVELMRASGRALLRVINDILDFSKIAAEEMVIDALPCDPRRTLIDTAQLFAPMIAARGVDFIVDLDPATPAAALGDAVRLRQVVTNLLQNAAKFTAEGHIRLATTWAPQTRVLSISVSDTGPGIARNRLKAVFEEFQQEHAVGDPHTAGTGLGLAIARRLVEGMGGEIGVESRPGAGSRFWLRIPLVTQPQQAAGPDAVGGLRVALWVDEPLLAASLRRLLEGAGCTLAEARPDVVLADLRILGDDPASALWELRAGATRAVVLAPPGQHVDGADAVVMTPVDPDALMRALSGAPLPGAEPAAAPTLPLRDDGTPVRVLVADDNEINRLIARKLLEALGCAVDVAGDGAEAVSRSAALRPDVILMDVSMPRMNGLEATAEIRRREVGGPRTPVIALTAHALAGHRDRCLDAGMDDHLGKPFSPEALAATLRRWAPRPTADIAVAATA